MRSRPLLQALLTGLAGTSVMTATTALEKALRRTDELPVDYDATGHVVTAAATVLHRPPRGHREATLYFAAVHWGYGSAVAGLHRALVGALHDRRRAAAVFYLACQGMAFTLFPTLGGTPPPWRWRRDVLASSLAQHAVYVATVAAVDRALEA